MEVKPLIAPQEFATLKDKESVVILDTRSAEEYATSHIPGAVNVREIFTHLATSTPEGLATLQSLFTDLLGKAGISGEERIVIYEDAMHKGFGQSCRGYFLLKYLGCEQVSVLHGGYQAWLAAGLATTSEVSTPVEKTFMAKIDPTMMVTTQQMLASLGQPAIVKLDVRDEDEWMGMSSSPYGVDFCPRKGRIPGAVWMEWYELMVPDAEVPVFRPVAEIQEMCKQVGITPETTVYIYCFKGSRASNTLIALKEAGIKDVRNYFASWNEWSRDPALPIEIVDSQFMPKAA